MEALMKVFISSTFRDLEKEREKLHISLKKAGLESLGMEFFVAEPNDSKEVCLREINEAQLVLLLIADSYGSIDEETQKSYTHLEFLEAQKAKIEILSFLKKEPLDSNVHNFQKEVMDSGITVDFFENISEIWRVLFPALFKYINQKGLLPNKVKTFNDFTQFYAVSSQKDSLFNYTQQLFGRVKELADLDSFLSDDQQQIAIISAAGGIGKSKLIYEFSQNKLSETDWDFRFVPYQVLFDNDSIRELSAKKTCVIIEDAHKQKALNTIIYSLINSFPYDIKIVITTRQSGLPTIQKALVDYNPALEIELAPLAKDDSIELSKTILKKEKQKHAEAICQHANGNTLVIVMASRLVNEKLLSEALFKEKVFKEKVLEKILLELDFIESRGVDLKLFLATVAALSPLEYNENVFELLSHYFKIEKITLKSILDDFQTHGFLVRIGSKLRVVPDILADYILYNVSVNISNESTGFIDSILGEFGANYLTNILTNTAELEYQVKKKPVNLTEKIWEIIHQRTGNCNVYEFLSILSTIEPVSYIAPKNVFEIVSKALNGNITLKAPDNNMPSIYDMQRVIASIISILGKLGRRPEFTKQVCLKLWEIQTEPDFTKFLDNFSESPSSVLKSLTSFDNNNWFSVQKEAMEAVRAIILDRLYAGHEQILCEIIESTLKPEIESNSYSKRTFTIGWFCAYDIKNENTLESLTKARNNAFETYDLLIDNCDKKVLYQITNNLIGKLRMPYLRRNQVTDKAKKEFEREARKAIELLKKIIAQKVSVLNNYIYEEVSCKEERLLDTVNTSDIISDDIKCDYEVFYCIRHDWPPRYGDDDFDSRDKRFNEKQEATAEKLWERCENIPEKLVDFINSYRDILIEHGIPQGDHAFLTACAKIKPELCPDVIDIIIDRDRSDYIASTISIWLQFSPNDLQYDLCNRILQVGNLNHRKSVSQSLTLFKGLSEKQLVDLIERLSKDSNSEVIDSVIRGLGVVCYHRKIEAELPKVVDVICNYEINEDLNKLEVLLDNLNPHWIDPDILTDDQIDIILEKIKYVKKLESQHDTGVFLSHITTRKPLELVKLFLWRIQNMSSDGAQPFPYNEGFHDKPTDLMNHPDYKTCIVEVIDAMEKYDWRAYFWCPTLVQWLDPLLTDITKEILLKSIGRHKNALKAITYIFVNYERDYFFGNLDFLNQLLVEASKPQYQKDETFVTIKGKLSFMPFSGTRWMSPPGEEDDLCLKIIEVCEATLQKNPHFFEVLKCFYEDLIEAAKHENQSKLDRDNAELQEEEF